MVSGSCDEDSIMKKILLIPAIIFLSLYLFPMYAVSEDRPDLAGWDKTKWGMSSEDIQRIYKAQSVEVLFEDENEITLAIKNYVEVEGTRPLVSLTVDRKSGLKRVSLCYNFREKGSALKIREAIASIQRSLEKTYGKPQEVMTVKGVCTQKVMSGNIDLHLSKWSFPSTEIALVEFWDKDRPTSYNLNYSPLSPKKF